MQKQRSVNLDERTVELLDVYREKYSLSRSAAIRSILNDVFIKTGVD